MARTSRPSPDRGSGRGLCPPQPASIDPSTGHRGVEPSMTATVFTHQRQLSQRSHRPVTAQNSISQLEQ